MFVMHQGSVHAHKQNSEQDSAEPCFSLSMTRQLCVLQEKTKEAGSIVADKAIVAKDKVGDAAVHAKDSVEDVFSSGSSQAQKTAEQAKRQAEEKRQQDEMQKRKDDMQKRKRKQKKKFGLF